MKDRFRTFVAVELSPEVRASLADEIARLRACGAHVKWVAEENLHLTLKFLGQTERHAVPEVLGALERAAREAKPFTMEVAGLAVFPKPVRPRVVVVGVGERALRDLAALAGRMEDELAPLGFKREARGFKAHITLGRVKSPRGVKALSDYLLTHDGAPVGSVEVGSVALIMSELRRTGPEYTVLGHAYLPPGRGVAG